MAKITINS